MSAARLIGSQARISGAGDQDFGFCQRNSLEGEEKCEGGEYAGVQGKKWDNQILGPRQKCVKSTDLNIPPVIESDAKIVFEIAAEYKRWIGRLEEQQQHYW